MANQDQAKRIIGGVESQVVVGVAASPVQNGLRGYALTVRIDGTIISAITVQDEGGQARAYAPTWLGIVLYAGEYFVSLSPITSITLTAAGDSVKIHCDKTF